MAQAPNTTNNGGFLKSVGNGSNQSFWSLPMGTYPTMEVDSATIAKGTTSVALSPTLDVSVQGYRNYLVIYNATVTNNDTGGAHDVYIRIALDSTLVGAYSRATCPAKAGGTNSYQALSTAFLVSTDTGSHTISGYGFVDNASSTTATALRAVITVIGLP